MGQIINLPFLSRSIEQEPTFESSPNVPQTPRQVGINVANAHTQVAATMTPR